MYRAVDENGDNTALAMHFEDNRYVTETWVKWYFELYCGTTSIIKNHQRSWREAQQIQQNVQTCPQTFSCL